MDDVDGLDARLLALLAKRGQDLVRSIIEEFRGLNHEIAALKRELSALSAYQLSRDRMLAIEKTSARIARMPRIAVIEPDQLLRTHDGFYPVEYTSNGTAFRWTGPSREFSFDVFIDRTHGAEIQLTALSCMDFEAQKDVALLADGEPVPLTMAPEGTGFTLTAFLPPRKGGGVTDLVYVLPIVLTPQASEDLRPLGIAFARFTAAACTAEEDGKAGAQSGASDVGDMNELDLGDVSDAL